MPGPFIGLLASPRSHVTLLVLCLDHLCMRAMYIQVLTSLAIRKNEIETRNLCIVSVWLSERERQREREQQKSHHEYKGAEENVKSSHVVHLAVMQPTLGYRQCASY